MAAAEAPPPDEPTGLGAAVTFAVRRESLVRDVAFIAVTAEIALVLLDLLVNYARPDGAGPIRRLFNITREDALPSWFASTQTMLIALTLCVIWALVKRRSGPAWSRRGWLGLAAFFFYMAVDDGAKVHERIGSALGSTFAEGSGKSDTWISRVVEAFPSYNWQLFVMPIFAAAGVLLFLFLWRELTDRRGRLLLVTAMACLVVAVGLDFIEGLDEEHPWNLHAHLDRWLELDPWAQAWFERSGIDTVVHFSKSIEEFLEMLANTLLWVVFLRHLTGLCRELRLRFG